MKKKLNRMALLCLITSTAWLSCQKESSQLPESSETPVNLVNYLSATLNIETNKIKFDSKSQEFYFTDNSLRFRLSDIEKRYESANIYRAQIKNSQ